MKWLWITITHKLALTMRTATAIWKRKLGKYKMQKYETAQRQFNVISDRKLKKSNNNVNLEFP